MFNNYNHLFREACTRRFTSFLLHFYVQIQATHKAKHLYVATYIVNPILISKLNIQTQYLTSSNQKVLRKMLCTMGVSSLCRFTYSKCVL